MFEQDSVTVLRNRVPRIDRIDSELLFLLDYSKAFSIDWNIEHIKVAVKKVRADEKSGENGISVSAIREINLLTQLHHRNVVRLKEIVVGAQLTSIFLVMEYCTQVYLKLFWLCISLEQWVEHFCFYQKRYIKAFSLPEHYGVHLHYIKVLTIIACITVTCIKKIADCTQYFSNWVDYDFRMYCTILYIACLLNSVKTSFDSWKRNDKETQTCSLHSKMFPY